MSRLPSAVVSRFIPAGEGYVDTLGSAQATHASLAPAYSEALPPGVAQTHERALPATALGCATAQRARGTPDRTRLATSSG